MGSSRGGACTKLSEHGLHSRFRVLTLGAGELATGVAHRLYRAGFTIIMTELSEPRAVRRTASFSECAFERTVSVEGVKATRVRSAEEALSTVAGRACQLPIPVIIDPDAATLAVVAPTVLIDGRMAERNLGDPRTHP